ncbi:hypothetical protein M408DRAFT_20589 [Serendipita vermifera MAFF 305830]|uniref:H/ACA ribonucleoprotein complex non-core subunit NAF1 n=1 Tax=Serendipita vermifera MAFF 305830 TaxID=933852 RepID=A0A0C3B607_SERVB|nr:hypothetical protein M408DRAFT_20589 [Serendipita vermifera MAFF 305830]
MSAPLDLEIIAGLLGPEELDPPSSNQGDQAHPIKVGGIAQEADTQDAVEEKTVEQAEMLQDEKEIDSEIPGLDVPPVQQNNDAEMSSQTATIAATASTSENGDGPTLDSILSKHGLQAVSDSSDEESSEESSESSSSASEDESTSESDSDSSDSSDSDSAASSEDLPMQDAGSDAGSNSQLKKSHKRNKAKLNKMIQEDAGSEDDIDLPTGAQPSSMFATAHEIIAPQVTMPSITEVPDDEPIEIIGEVMSIVDSVVVVKSLDNGMQRVLDTDSLLVLENRKVLGLVFETFGPLTAPLYSIRFPSAAHFPPAITAFVESPAERPKVYYCPSRSTFAYTSKLMLSKGNDASNLYDEEVGEDELEFSDDEAEREWKRLHETNGKRKRRAGSRAGSTYSESPQIGGRTSIPYGDEMGESVNLSYVDPYDDEADQSPAQSPSTSNGPPISPTTPSGNPPSLPSRAYHDRDARGRPGGRGRSGRGQGSFAGDRRGGRGRGEPMRGRGRQPPLSMPPPTTSGYHDPNQYDPSFSANISPTAGHYMSQPMNMGGNGGMYPHGGGYNNAAYANNVMGMQPYGFGMPAGGAPMYPMIPNPGITQPMAGPAPGAFVNPRFAMMQLMSPGGRGDPNAGQYPGASNPQPGRQDYPR